MRNKDDMSDKIENHNTLLQEKHKKFQTIGNLIAAYDLNDGQGAELLRYLLRDPNKFEDRGSGYSLRQFPYPSLEDMAKIFSTLPNHLNNINNINNINKIYFIRVLLDELTSLQLNTLYKELDKNDKENFVDLLVDELSETHLIRLMNELIDLNNEDFKTFMRAGGTLLERLTISASKKYAPTALKPLEEILKPLFLALQKEYTHNQENLNGIVKTENWSELRIFNFSTELQSAALEILNSIYTFLETSTDQFPLFLCNLCYQSKITLEEKFNADKSNVYSRLAGIVYTRFLGPWLTEYLNQEHSVHSSKEKKDLSKKEKLFIEFKKNATTRFIINPLQQLFTRKFTTKEVTLDEQIKVNFYDKKNVSDIEGLIEKITITFIEQEQLHMENPFDAAPVKKEIDQDNAQKLYNVIAMRLVMNAAIAKCISGLNTLSVKNTNEKKTENARWQHNQFNQRLNSYNFMRTDVVSLERMRAFLEDSLRYLQILEQEVTKIKIPNTHETKIKPDLTSLAISLTNEHASVEQARQIILNLEKEYLALNFVPQKFTLKKDDSIALKIANTSTLYLDENRQSLYKNNSLKDDLLKKDSKENNKNKFFFNSLLFPKNKTYPHENQLQETNKLKKNKQCEQIGDLHFLKNKPNNLNLKSDTDHLNPKNSSTSTENTDRRANSLEKN